jgi:alpha-beta hydrolase superfamily lysophospholipase
MKTRTTNTEFSRTGKFSSASSGAKGSILMIHGIFCTGKVWGFMARAFRKLGWRVETPTIGAHLRSETHAHADLPKLKLADYVAEMEAVARRIEAETGRPPVVFGHSLGGLIAQKLAERGVVRAAVLLTPAQSADLPFKPSLALFKTAFTMASMLFTPNARTKALKLWKTSFTWGMLNCVPRARHDELYAATCHDSGHLTFDLANPDQDPERSAYVDETRIAAPVLTIGAAKDRTIPIDVQRQIAEKYQRVGGDYLEYADNAHWILDEPGTDQVIADIVRWLDEKGLGRSSFAPHQSGSLQAA